MLCHPKNVYWFQLKPGKVLSMYQSLSQIACLAATDQIYGIVFDNWHVLHGSSAFTGKRRMCGGYSKSLRPYSFILRLKLTALCSSQPRRLHLQVPHDQPYERGDRCVYCDWLKWQSICSGIPKQAGSKSTRTFPEDAFTPHLFSRTSLVFQTNLKDPQPEGPVFIKLITHLSPHHQDLMLRNEHSIPHRTATTSSPICFTV